MPILKWEYDQSTLEAAIKYRLPTNPGPPAPQYHGGNAFLNVATWVKNNRGIDGDMLNHKRVQPSPENIMDQFRDGHYLNGIALIAVWGGMVRNQNRIYCRANDVIRDALGDCCKDIRKNDSINVSWARLTGTGDEQLGWSHVMTSKTLHFLCRSLGYDQNPPVAIDNAVILNKVWPTWKQQWLENTPREQRPGNWDGNDLVSYLRYMTAINIWALMRKGKWSTTNIETTIFATYKRERS